MTAQQNIDLVKSYIDLRMQGKYEAALENVADDITHRFMFTMPGTPGIWRGKAEILNFISHVRSLFPDGTTFDIQKIHATEGSVIVESVNGGKTRDGIDYSNRYCFIYDIENGKIKAIREYTDSAYSIDTLVKKKA